MMVERMAVNVLMMASVLLSALLPVSAPAMELAKEPNLEGSARTKSAHCHYYPFGLPSVLLDGAEQGERFHYVGHLPAAEGFSWLTWSGSPSAWALAASLQAPGNSDSYQNPFASTTGPLSVGDWVRGGPGPIIHSVVDARLDDLRGEAITVPVWSAMQDQAGQGYFQVDDFAQIRLLEHYLPEETWISFEFIDWSLCSMALPLAHGQSLSTTKNTELAIELTGEHPQGEALSFELLSQPENGALSGQPPQLQYQPHADYVGIDAFTFLVRDAAQQASEPATVSIEITEAPQLPVAHDQSLSTEQNTELAIELTGEHPQGEALSFELLSQPSHGTLVGQPPQLHYQPNPDFVGSDEFTFLVRDDQQASEPATVSIEVTEAPEPPVAHSQTLVTDQNTPVDIELTGDHPRGLALSFALRSEPNHGTLVGRPPQLQYQPDTDFVGTDEFEFIARGPRSGSAPATISIQVAAINRPPEIVSSPVTSVALDQVYLYDVEAVDPDPGDIVSYSLVHAPKSMTIDAVSGLIEWQPEAEYANNHQSANNFCYGASGLDGSTVSAADLVFVIDESGSMSGEFDWAAEFSISLEAHLLANRVGFGDKKNLYGLIGYERVPRPLPVGDGQMGNLSEFLEATELLRTSGGTEDGWRAMRHALLEYPLRDDVSTNIILVTDEGRDITDPDITYESLLAEFNDANAILNAVVNARFRCIDESGDWVPALGMDADGVGYLADGLGGYLTCSDAEATWGHTNTINTLYAYVDLALDTKGAAWDLRFLRDGGPDAVSFARALNDIKIREILEQAPPTPLADLSVTSLVWQNGEITARVANRGLLDAGEGSRLRVFADGGLLFDEAIPALEAGASLERSMAFLPQGGGELDLHAEIIPAATQRECTTQNHRLSAPMVTVQATDTGGLSDSQTYSLNVEAAHQPPAFVSTPASDASLGAYYRYQAEAVSPVPGNALRYELVSGPPGMFIDAYSGLLRYLPNAAQLGAQQVLLRVQDLNGATAEQAFELQVSQDYQFPSFVPIDDIHVVIDTPVSVLPEVVADPRADLVFTLLMGPEGMSVNASTGEIHWLVDSALVGQRVLVTAEVRDQFDNYDVLLFEFLVDKPNEAPVITSDPNLFAQMRRYYDYRLRAENPNYFASDSDEQFWSIDHGPDGVAVNASSGQLRWDRATMDATAPEGLRNHNPYCLIRDHELASIEARESWRWTSGVSRITQPLVLPMFLDQSLAPIGYEDRQLVVAISWSGGGVSGRGIHGLDLQTGEQLWSYADQPPNWHVSPASADLDNSGIPNIVYVDQDNHLVAIDSAGALHWVSQQPVAAAGTNLAEAAIVIADIDQSGRPEIIVGSSVFYADGTLAWRFPDSSTWHNEAHRASPLVADLTGDGRLEVAMYDQVRDASGALLWTLPLEPSETLHRAHFGVGDLTGDGNPELLASIRSNQGVALLAVASNGALLWRVDSDPSLYVSPPLVADFSRDGRNDVFLPGGSMLLDADGQVVWQQSSVISRRDYRTAMASDLNGDGWLEILMLNNNYLAVIAGSHGELLYTHSWSQRSDRVGTLPALVRPGNDQRSRLVLGGTSGLLVLQPEWGDWPTQATSFNQVELAPASPRHQNLRVLHPPVLDEPATTFLSDLHIEAPRALMVGNSKRLQTAVRNRGLIPVPAPVHVEVYRGDPQAGGQLLLHRVLEQTIAAGETVAVEEPGFTRAELEGELFALVWADDNDLIECESGNNLATGRSMQARVEDQEGLSDTQFWVVGVQQARYTPTFLSSAPRQAVENEPYHYQAGVVDDPGIGNVVRFSIVSGPESAQINPATGELTWTPAWGETGRVSFRIRAVDLDNHARNQIFNVDVAESSLPNEPPVILSQPITSGQLGELYEYPVIAEDPADLQLSYSLLQAPDNMSIHPGTGLISWVPTESWPDPVPVSIEVRNQRGASAEQSYQIVVYDQPNQAPVISSSPTLSVDLGDTWGYQLAATDPDDDPLEYALLNGPQGAVMDALGLTEWTPTADQLGENGFVLEVRDDRGGWARQSFTVFVNDPASNQAPEIISEPPLIAYVGLPYTYQVDAFDPDGDTLHYQLQQAPGGASVDSQSGLLQWTPLASHIGAHEFELHVLDGNGGIAWQQFVVVVEQPPVGNRPPSIHSTPPLTAKAGFPYHYTVVASDPDGDLLSYTLVDGPPDMQMDANTGELYWQPAAEGVYPVAVEVSDGELNASQQWSIDVLDGAVALELALEITPAVTDVGQEVEIRLIPQAAAGAVSTEVSVNGSAVTVGPDLVARYQPTAPGPHEVQAQIDDGFEQAQAEGSFFARDPNADGPYVSLLTPHYEAEITQPTSILGTVQDADLAGWTLAFAEAGTGDWNLMAEGDQPFAEADLAVFDPTLMLNGQYQIVLQAWDSQGRSSVDSREVQVTGDMKLGHFSITFEDLNIPMAGMPVQVTRTYDTRQRHRNLDFGHGWSVDYQNVRVHESRTPGFGWELMSYPSGPMGLVPNYCVEPSGDPIVTVTLPDGQVERFRAKASPECNQAVPILDVDLVFEPLDGTYSQLDALHENRGRLINNSISEVTNAGVPLDPDQYRLTLDDGTQYTLDQHFGLRRVFDPVSEQSLDFTRDGITHSAGLSVEFERDADERISTIRLPDGNALHYSYDAQGNLVGYTDAAGHQTTYQYLDGHYLEEIHDPRGQRVARNIYNDEGRLIAHIDADGNRIEFAHDLAGRSQAITDRLGNTTVHVFNQRGDITAETNALGETTLRSYDPYGNQLSETDPLGNTQAWAYDNRGNVIRETDALGIQTHYEFGRFKQIHTMRDNEGELLQSYHYNDTTVGGVVLYPGPLERMVDALGQNTRFAYDASTGELSRLIDAAGNITQMSYDSRGNKIAEIDPRGHRTEYSYDDMGRMLSETRYRTLADGSEQALTTHYGYDANGNLTQTTDPLGNVRRTEYNALGKVAAEVDALNRRTEFEYDARGHLVKTTYPDGSTETVEYDAEGQEIARIDRAGRRTEMVYDAAGRLIETRHPPAIPGEEAVSTFNVYNAAGQMIESIDANGNRTHYEYDAAGRQIKVTDAKGNSTVTAYDSRGRRSSVTDAQGLTTRFEYDAADRLVKTIYHDETFSTVEYDAAGRKTAETDPAGQTTRFEYDAAGNLTAVIDAKDQRTEYGYNERGLRVSQTDANGHVTGWLYDELGRVISRTLPEGQTESYAYDAVGNRIRHTDFNGQTIHYHYDAMDRLVRTEYPDGHDVHTRYTASGQVAEVEVACSPAPCSVDGKALGITAYSYDGQDRLTRIQHPDGRWIEYSYDAAGNRTELRTENQTVRYGFDALNRLETVTACDNTDCTAGDTTRYRYNKAGSRTAIVHANGSQTSYQYDNRHRLVELTTLDAFGQTIQSQRFTLGDAGHRLAVEEHGGRQVEYSYDALYRMTEERVTDPRGNRVTTYTFDATGNRLSRTVSCDPTCNGEITAGTTTYSYDKNDRLLEETGPDGTTIYTYDDNGNTLEKQGPDGITVYTYDANDRLIKATGALESTAIETRYVYDVHGVRQGQWVDGQVTRFLVDPNRDYAQVIEELGATGAAEALYVFGHERISQDRNGTHSTYHADGLGSIRALSRLSGERTDRYDYNAYGQLEHSEGTTRNDFRYTGEQYDPNLGFYYLRARYYNPANGRFPTMDTYQGRIHEPQTLHKYLYVHGDPVNNIDPSGHMSLSSLVTAKNISSAFAVMNAGVSGFLVGRGGYAIYEGRYADGAKDIAFGFMGTGLAAAGTYRLIRFTFGPVNAAIRAKYVSFLGNDIPRRISLMRSQGKTAEQIAFTVVAMRNSIKMEARSMMVAAGPSGRFMKKMLELRNIHHYKHPVGPTVEWYLRRNRSYEDIIQSALKSSDRVNRMIGGAL